MTTERRRWWRAAAIAAVGGIAVTGGWFGLVRAKPPAKPEIPTEATDWTRSAAPAPTVAEVERDVPAPEAPGAVVPAGATLPPIPLSGSSSPVAPAIPVTPPVVLPAAPLPVPALPAVPPAPVAPASGPRSPDAGLTGASVTLPAVPALPPLPPVALPDLSTPPKPAAPSKDTLPMPPVTPVSPAAPMLPALPAVPSAVEPPKAPAVGVAPMLPTPPMPVALPLPTLITPTAPPAKPTEPMQPVPPAKPNSDLKPTNPPNTLNPTVAPAVPVVPGPGKETPGLPVDRSKPPQPPFDPTDKFVLPVKPVAPVGPDPRAVTQRDDTMFNLTTAAAFAVFGGALMAEKATALPPMVPITPMTAVPLKADEKADVEKLTNDLKAANTKIESLEKQVKLLSDLLTGKKDSVGQLIDPTAPGAVAEVKALKDEIASLKKQLADLKTQTALKPAVLPEAKPKGVVRIINDYPVEISMLINGNKPSYRVAPNTSVDIEVPVGDFTYELLQSGQGPVKSVITKEKEVVKLRIK